MAGVTGTDGLDGFLVKLTPDESSFVYSTYVGFKGAVLFGLADACFDVTADDQGCAYVVGTTSGDLAGPLAGPGLQLAHGGGAADAFVFKYDPAGQRIAETYLGGTSDEFATRVVWRGRKLYVAGVARGKGFPAVAAGGLGSPLQKDYGGPDSPSMYQDDKAELWSVGDGFLSILSDDLLTLEYSTYVGFGDGVSEAIYGLAVEDGVVYVCGKVGTPNQSLTQPAQLAAFDAFVAAIKPGGNGAADLAGLFSLQGSGFDVAREVVVESNHVHVCGSTRSPAAGSNFAASTGLQQSNLGASCVLPSGSVTFDGTDLHGPNDGDAFLASFDVDLATQKFFTYLGAGTDEEANGIAGVGGSVVIVGFVQTLPSSFPHQFPFCENSLFNSSRIAQQPPIPAGNYFGGQYSQAGVPPKPEMELFRIDISDL